MAVNALTAAPYGGSAYQAAASNLPSGSWMAASQISQLSPMVGGGEGAEYDPYADVRQDLAQEKYWLQALPTLGFTGPVTAPQRTEVEVGESGERRVMMVDGPTPEAKAFIQNLKAQGYDLAVDMGTASDRTTKYGVLTPQGQIVAPFSTTDKTFLQAIGPVLAIAAAAYGANLLASGAGGGAGAGLGLAEGMAPGGLASAGIPATAAELSAANALTAGAVPNALAGGAQSFPVSDVSIPTQSYPVAPQPSVTTGPMGGADLYADLAGATPSTPTVPPTMPPTMPPTVPSVGAEGATAPSTFRPSADYGPGMTGAQTTAYDTAMNLTGAPSVAAAAAGGAGLLQDAINLINTPVGAAALGAVGDIVGGITEAGAVRDAATQQAQAAQNALALQREMFEYQKGLQAPYRQAGEAALNRLTGIMQPGGAQQLLEMDPGYGFRLGEGMKALDRLQASRGNLLSGGAIKAGQRYAQDVASQEYGSAFNRLAKIAGFGETAGQQLGSAASGYGTNAGNLMTGLGNVQAAGTMGRASAYSNALGGAMNQYTDYMNRQQQNQLLRDIYGRLGG